MPRPWGDAKPNPTRELGAMLIGKKGVLSPHFRLLKDESLK